MNETKQQPRELYSLLGLHNIGNDVWTCFNTLDNVNRLRDAKVDFFYLTETDEKSGLPLTKIGFTP